MAKYREIVYDLLKDLRQIYDDKQITPYQVLWWVSVIGNDLLKKHLDNEYKRTGWMSGNFLTVFPNVKVLDSPTSYGNIVKHRKHFVLPSGILDFDFERGVNYISYVIDTGTTSKPAFTSVIFQRTTAARAQRLYVSFEEPKPDNPYFYFQGSVCYLLGIEDTKVEEVEVSIYTAIDPSTVRSMDEEFEFPEHLKKQLMYDVMALGSWVMSVPEDKVNDGNSQVQTNPMKQQQQDQSQQE